MFPPDDAWQAAPTARQAVIFAMYDLPARQATFAVRDHAAVSGDRGLQCPRASTGSRLRVAAQIEQAQRSAHCRGCARRRSTSLVGGAGIRSRPWRARDGRARNARKRAVMLEQRAVRRHPARLTACARCSAGTGSQGLPVEKPPLGAPLPHHRRAAAVAALELRPELDAVGILQILEGELRFGQAQFLALIEADRAAQRIRSADERPSASATRSASPVGPARGVAHRRRGWRRPSRPSRRRAAARRLPTTSRDVARRQRIGRQEVEGVAHVHLVAAGGVLRRRSPARAAHRPLRRPRRRPDIRRAARGSASRKARFSGWLLS